MSYLNNDTFMLVYTEVINARKVTDALSKALQHYPKGNIGLAIRSDEYVKTKHAFDIAFNREKELNVYLNKNFKKEVKEIHNEQRNARFKQI